MLCNGFIKKKTGIITVLYLSLAISCFDNSNPSSSGDGSPPEITTQPVGVIASVGEEIYFSIEAEGRDLSYQWQADGADIYGEYSSLYSFTAQDADSGKYYRCIVSNSEGSDTSEAVRLDVLENLPSVMGTWKAVEFEANGSGVIPDTGRLVLDASYGYSMHYIVESDTLNDNGTWEENGIDSILITTSDSEVKHAWYDITNDTLTMKWVETNSDDFTYNITTVWTNISYESEDTGSGSDEENSITGLGYTIDESDTSLDLTWENNPDVINYTVYYQKGSGIDSEDNSVNVWEATECSFYSNYTSERGASRILSLDSTYTLYVKGLISSSEYAFSDTLTVDFTLGSSSSGSDESDIEGVWIMEYNASHLLEQEGDTSYTLYPFVFDFRSSGILYASTYTGTDELTWSVSGGNLILADYIYDYEIKGKYLKISNQTVSEVGDTIVHHFVLINEDSTESRDTIGISSHSPDTVTDSLSNAYVYFTEPVINQDLALMNADTGTVNSRYSVSSLYFVDDTTLEVGFYRNASYGEDSGEVEISFPGIRGKSRHPILQDSVVFRYNEAGTSNGDASGSIGGLSYNIQESDTSLNLSWDKESSVLAYNLFFQKGENIDSDATTINTWDSTYCTLYANYTSERGASRIIQLDSVYTMYVRGMVSSSEYLYSDTITLTFSLQGGSESEIEPNDTYTEATQIPIDSSVVSAEINPSSDSDWYSFQVSAGTSLDIHAGDGSVDLELSLYDTDGETVITWVDYALSDGTEIISNEFSESGVYYIEVEHYSQSDTGPYNVWIIER